MFQRNMNEGQGDERQSVTLRDLLSVGFRQKRLMINTFLGIFSLVIVLAAILPRKYQSEMKILVRHERADNMVTPDREQPMQLRTDVSEAAFVERNGSRIAQSVGHLVGSFIFDAIHKYGAQRTIQLASVSEPTTVGRPIGIERGR